MKTTEEKYTIIKNRMIAEFMGFKVMKEDDFLANPRAEHLKNVMVDVAMKYHTSWEWLMSAWKHINSISGSRFILTIRPDFCYILDTNTDKEIVYNEHGATELELVYETVIQFIKWYNENK